MAYRISDIFTRLLLSFFLIFAVTLVNAQQKATPKSGEGIAAFLFRHNRSPKKYMDDFLELNKSKLGRKQELRLGVSYIIPPVKSGKSDSKSASVSKNNRKKTVYEPLFGKSNATVKIRSRRLEGACFYVVSGHGGPDPGAIGKSGKHELHEDEYAYDIALRLARDLMEEGADVHIIIQDAKDGIRNGSYLSNSKRETCMGDAIPLNQVARLKQRCDKINSLYSSDRKRYSYCRAIFIHVDSRGKGKQMDVFFYNAQGSTLGKRLATTMKNTFEAKYDKHQPNRGFSGTVSERGLYVLGHTTPVSVFVELGNIQNQSDLRRLILSSNREALAKWLKDGFIADYNKSK